MRGISCMLIFIFASCSTLNYNQRLDFDKDDITFEDSHYAYGNDYYEEHVFDINGVRFKLGFLSNQKSILFSPLPLIPLIPCIGTSFNRMNDRFKTLSLFVDIDVYTEQNITIPGDKIQIILKDTSLFSMVSNGDFTNEDKLRARKVADILLGKAGFSEFRSLGSLDFNISFDQLEDFQLQFDSVKINDEYTNITFPKMKVTNRLVYRPIVIYTH